MNHHLQHLLESILQSEHLSDNEKASLSKEIQKADKEMEVIGFKLDKTEQVKRTTAILLEETIAELEQKRKAVETQNRELEIEAALERVRSRTMAMQSSSELPQAANLLFQQIQYLGIPAFAAGYCIWENDKQAITLWMSSEGVLQPPFKAPTTEDELFIQMRKGYEEGKLLHVVEMGGEELVAHYRYMRTLPVVGDIFNSILEAGHSLPVFQVMHQAYFSKGFLLFITYERVPQAHDIFKRFATVFDQTYTRFLDLQKAEAQSRESQIQLALERVRARTMAMHKSEELAETAQLMFHQLQELGDIPDRISIGVANESAGVVNFWTTDQSGSHINNSFAARLNEPTVISKTYQAWKNNSKSLIIDLHGDELTQWIRFAREEMGIFVKDEFIHDRRVHTITFFSHGWIFVTTHEPQSTTTIQILERFASVFNLTYRRFLDLQKAESQAREAQIEAALEKVRSRSLAMHKSEELQEVANTLFEKLTELDIKTDSANIAIFKEGTKDFEFWIGSPYQKLVKSFPIPYSDLLLTKDLVAARESGSDFYAKTYSFEEKNEWFSYVFKNTALKFLSEERKQMILDAKTVTISIAFARNTGVQITRYSDELLSQEKIEILKRFSKVFEQAYIRFLDLQKAEASAREAQIEAALERVRSKTMAMHNSKDVANTVATMFDELVKLGVETFRCGIGIMLEKEQMEVWTAKHGKNGKADLVVGHLDMSKHRLLHGAYNGWRNKKESFSYELKDNDLTNYFTMINDHADYPVKYDISSLPSQIFHHDFYFSEGTLFVFSVNQLSAEALQILKRFAGVFGQTYRRYRDLQKAETQAREAQIEAALERVRSRTMAMHQSQEIGDIVGKIFGELRLLDLVLNRVLIWIFNDDQKYITWWSANPEAESNAESYRIDYNDQPVFLNYFQAWQNRNPLHLYTLSGDTKKDWEDHLFNNTELSRLPMAVRKGMREESTIFTTSTISDYGLMMVGSYEPLSNENTDIIQRFGRVFQQSYTRYLDVQKAEAQAKEAQIEAALEKVRGKAMAMHNSSDLSATASMVITELRKLEITPIRCGVGILNKESYKAQLYTATSSPEGDSLSVIGSVLLEGHSVLEKIYQTWVHGEDYFPELSGDLRRSYYEQLLTGLPVPLPNFNDSEKHYGHFFAVSVGCLYAWADRKYNDDEIKILKRFASIIDLTFRRYFELQQSEENAREAVRQASLDRVRAEIASMRTTTDLEKITPLIWNELTILGIPFIRCGIFIMDDSQKLIHTFLSTPEGKAIASFHLPYATPGNIAQVLNHWQDKKNYVDHWDESAFTEFADILVEQGGLASAEQYLETIPHGGFYLHFLPFLQGMLYVGNTAQLGEDEIKLIQSVADAFSTAYARYEDFNKLEAAKKQVDSTLNELQATQKQLIQSEKMASLGELTAGIAHEIQNPLNFVNNFSEVSTELLDEMIAELKDNNQEDAVVIATDVKQNLEKILHHGKRADGIVKGMLQHSRSSSAVKEPTDINKLADEYLRLAYHGLRAKDNFFNATIKTDFDETIGNINIIPQDIGRVILNLLTNAFYAVTEKRKQVGDGYEPVVSLNTRKINGTTEIKVSDNGNGIPQKVLDKIFQPFFTTKPTGQGTGLGLSLSYDIIKSHGGVLEVTTKEGKGSDFVIELPIV